IKQVYDECNSVAEQHGSALMPACAFEYALGDAASALAASDFAQTDEVAIYYAIGGFGTSRGTKKSIIRAITSPAYVYQDGRHIISSPAAEQRAFEFPKLGRRNMVSF